MNQGEYYNHIKAHIRNRTPLFEHANSLKQRRANARLERKAQSFWSEQVNLIFAMNDSHASGSLKAPIIFFGDGNFGTRKGSRSGNYRYASLF